MKVGWATKHDPTTINKHMEMFKNVIFDLEMQNIKVFRLQMAQLQLTTLFDDGCCLPVVHHNQQEREDRTCKFKHNEVAKWQQSHGNI